MDRSTLANTQYRPVSQAETQTNDALSVRALRDIALGADNAFARACAPHLCDVWPYGTTGTMYSAHNDTDEHVLGGLARTPAVHCGYSGHYTHAAWSAYAFLAASSNNCTVRLYSAQRWYGGASTLTTTTKALLGSYSSDDQSCTSATGEMLSAGDFALLLHPNELGETYFMVTAQFAAASANNGIYLLHLAITLGRSELAVIL